MIKTLMNGFIQWWLLEILFIFRFIFVELTSTCEMFEFESYVYSCTKFTIVSKGKCIDSKSCFCKTFTLNFFTNNTEKYNNF